MCRMWGMVTIPCQVLDEMIDTPSPFYTLNMEQLVGLAEQKSWIQLTPTKNNSIQNKVQQHECDLAFGFPGNQSHCYAVSSFFMLSLANQLMASMVTVLMSLAHHPLDVASYLMDR